MAATHARTPAVDVLLERKQRSPWADALQRMARNRAAIAGLVVVTLFALVAVFAGQIAPHNPLQIYRGAASLPPAWVAESATGKAGDPRFLLGTDSIGRDLLSRLIYGARVSMVTGLLPSVIIAVIGTGLGLLAGYAGGWVDNAIMRVTDVFYAFPDMLVYIIMMASLRDTTVGQWFGGLFLLFGALALVSWVGVARLVRGSVLAVRQKEYVEAARCVGASPERIMLRHILPNVLGPLVVLVAFSAPRMIIVEAVLGYLGLGLKPATDPGATFISSWGSLLLEGQSAISSQPALLLAPAVCVALVVLSLTFVGDGLRDALDPRMKV
ncbi:MAG: ABC transporter permease [Anaerolineae bacterium]